MREGRREEWRRGSGFQPSIRHPASFSLLVKRRAPTYVLEMTEKNSEPSPEIVQKMNKVAKMGYPETTVKRSETFRS